MHHLPEEYIRDAIKNPLLFQENNPLISQSMSLLNSRHQKSHNDSEIEHLSSQEMSGRTNYKKCNQQDKQPDQSQQVQHDQDRFNEENDEEENIRAIKQFEREIQEKFKISIANKLYTFPRLNITSIMDIISSSEEEEKEKESNEQSNILTQKQSSRIPFTQYNPFDPKHYQRNMKTEHFQVKHLKQKSTEEPNDRNFKKVKNSTKKEKKDSALKKNLDQKLTHPQKHKNTKKNPEVTTVKQKIKLKNPTKNQTQKLSSRVQRQSSTKGHLDANTRKQHHEKGIAHRLKTEMNNDQSRMSQSITESRRRFYQEELFGAK